MISNLRWRPSGVNRLRQFYIFVSAQTGVEPATGTVPDGGIGAECQQAPTNLAQALIAAGSDISKIMRITLFYTNLEHLPAINAVFAEVFPAEPPRGLPRS